MSHPEGIVVLFSDAALLVIDKPAGLRTLPDGYDTSLPHIKSLLEQDFGPLWIVHRLDKETSGVLLLARNAHAHQSLNTQFEQHSVCKVYHAVVKGNPDWQEKTIRLPLRPNGDRHHRTVVDLRAGKPAITHFYVLERLGEYCLLAATPETGRTHQIRAHCSAMGLFILGDKLYGSRPAAQSSQQLAHPVQEGPSAAVLEGGMLLHARSLEINHPITGERIKFEAPYPGRWLAVLKFIHGSSAG